MGAAPMGFERSESTSANMAKSTDEGDPYDIAALRKKAPGQFDLMRAGNGTPWEDRGSLGIPAAFLKTCFRSMFHPQLLLDHLRRPDTSGDATSFAVFCGLMWSVGVLVWDVVNYFQVARISQISIDGQQYSIETAGRCLLAAAAVVFFAKFSAALFTRLSAGELKGVPSVLTYNLFAYCLGPSLLAVIPWLMPVAAIWILVNMIIAARKRLFMSSTGAIINSILTFLSAAAILTAIYYFGWLVCRQIFANPVSYPQPAAPPGHRSGP